MYLQRVPTSKAGAKESRGEGGWGWDTHICLCICTQEHMSTALGRRTGNSRRWVEMGEERRVLISSMRNAEQEPHLTGVLRGQQGHFRIRRENSEEEMTQTLESGKPHPIPQMGFGWCHRGNPLLEAQKIRVPKGEHQAVESWELGGGQTGERARCQWLCPRAASWRGGEQSTVSLCIGQPSLASLGADSSQDPSLELV